MAPILNETVSNQTELSMINNLTSQNINDYIYDQIYKKNKKNNYVSNNKFITKYLDKPKIDNSSMCNGPEYKELYIKKSEETWKIIKE
jgi:hypothetical protein